MIPSYPRAFPTATGLAGRPLPHGRVSDLPFAKIKFTISQCEAFEHVIAHELGHRYGLPQGNDAGNVMYDPVGETDSSLRSSDARHYDGH
jgi:hypothetical protein